MTPLELTQWESNSLSAAVPAATVDGTTLFVNYLGHVFAVDLTERQDALAVGVVSSPRAATPCRISPGCSIRRRFAIVAAGEHVWALARDMKDQNYVRARSS